MNLFDSVQIDPKLLVPIGLAVSFGVYFLLRVGLGRALRRSVKNEALRFQALKGTNLILNCLLLIAVFELVAGENLSTASFLGLLSAGIAFVFREPILNLAAWLFIIIRQPFSLGDRIQIGEKQAGDVIDIGIHDFTILEIGNWVDADQSTGRILHVPNSVIFTQPIANYHQGFPYLWHELRIDLTLDSNWERALEVFQDIASAETEVDRQEQAKVVEELANQEAYLIRFKHLTPIVYLSKSEYSLILTIRYCCEPRARRSTEARLWKSLLKAVAQAEDYWFAYPTRSVHLHSRGEVASLHESA